MSQPTWDETLINTEVTYILELDGAIIVIEGVPAQVNTETGERYFAPDTVEQLHRIIHSDMSPQRIMQTPVFRFAA
jgi:hypothetical protein